VRMDHQKSNNVAVAYYEFEAFRAEFIKKWCERASFKEKRKDGDIRPVVLLKTNKDVSEFNLDLQNDKRLLAILATDPDRFSPKASKFKPILDPIPNITKVSISQPPATNSRKKTKAEILKSLGRLVDRLEHTVLTSGTQHSIDALDTITKEYDAIKDHPEETYRVRTYGYTDTAVYMTQNGLPMDKARIPITGMFIIDLRSQCVVSTQEQADPKDSIKYYPVTPVPCSAILKGILYRQSDIDEHNSRKNKKTA
jgi:hypothetical protein